MVTPSSDLETSGPIAGQLVFTDNNEIVTTLVDESVVIVLGQFVTFDAEGNAILATDTIGTQYDGIGIACFNPNSISTATATLTGASTDDSTVLIQVAVGNTYCYTLATGAIKFQSAVGATSGSYAQALTVQTAVTNSASIVTAINAYAFVAGRYWGHSKEEKTPTPAVSSDIIAVRLGL